MKHKRILFIVPPVTLAERYGSLEDAGTSYPPLGLAYLAAVAEKHGCNVRVIDSEAEELGYNDIKDMVDSFKPDIVGMQTYCTNIQQCLKVAKIIKELDSNTKTILGGAQVTLFYDTPYENIDYIIRGEGEVVFEELLQGKKLGLINGLVWKHEGDILVNPKQELIKDLDTIPFPARHLFPIDKYHSSAQLRGNKTLNIMTSRGCCYRCCYCSGGITFGKTFRYFSTNRVITELKHLIEKFGVDSIQFYDETFTVNRKRVIELCRAMIENKVNLPWACFTRVNLVDEELLREMKAAGAYQIFFGTESGNQRLLDMIKKDITLDQSRKAIKLCKKVGIQAFCSFMLNLPTETIEESKQTIDFAIELNPEFVQFPITTPFPGTELYDIAKQSGTFVTEDWSKFMSWEAIVYVAEGRTVEEIKETVKKAYRRFYLRPSFILMTLNRLRKLPFKKQVGLIKAGIKTFVR